MEKRTFQQHISNEDTAKLPAVLFDGPIVIVDDEKQVEAACRDLASSPVLGFDTETRPSFKAGVTYRVALLQLSTPRRCYLFRLNRMRFEKQLVKLLENKAILKIGADATSARCWPCAASGPAASSTCNNWPPTGASKRRACASFRPSCWASASRKPSG